MGQREAYPGSTYLSYLEDGVPFPRPAPRVFTESPSPTLVPHSYVTVGRSGKQCTHSLSSEVGRSVGTPRTNDRYMTW